MKTKRIIHIVLIVAIFGVLSCKNTPAQNEYSEEKITEMLNSFYTNYVTVSSKGLPRSIEDVKLDSITSKYCTPELLNYIHKLFQERELDYNPFLSTQMWDIRILKTLTIKKDSIKNNLYYVSYTYGEPTTITVKVVKEKDCYKIDHIFLAGLQEETP